MLGAFAMGWSALLLAVAVLVVRSASKTSGFLWAAGVAGAWGAPLCFELGFRYLTTWSHPAAFRPHEAWSLWIALPGAAIGSALVVTSLVVGLSRRETRTARAFVVWLTCAAAHAMSTFAMLACMASV